MLLPQLSSFSGILPILFFGLFFRRNNSGGIWVILLYCLVSVFSDFAYSRLITKAKIDQFYIYGCFTIIEYTLFALFLYLSLTQKKLRYVLVAGSLFFYSISLFILFHKTGASFDSVSASLESILIIIYSILYLYEQIKDPSVFYVYQLKKFWIIIAILLYLSSTLFLFLYAATFARPGNSTFWIINNLSDILKNVFISISFVIKKDKKQQYSLEGLYPDV